MSQTSAFVKKLASNEKPTREAALESLKRYLTSKSSKKLSLLDMEKLWKGLYYSMWFCDRSKAQERLAEGLGQLYSGVVSVDQFALFLEAFCAVIIKEWPAIDQWRIDKYYLLIRRVLRHSFKFIKQNNWGVATKKKVLDQFVSVLNKTILSGDMSVPAALPYHFCDVYLDELEIVMFEELSQLQSEIDDLDASDKNYDSKIEELVTRKREIAEDVPISELTAPFARLAKEARTKTLRDMCKKEVLADSRLKTWGVVEQDEQDEKDGDENEEEAGEDSDEEWTGF
ncbi:Nop52-domain-containing protein [Suhomyces tanzawaensis NRRL Y-17324]|uniref:Nop52-domain-containing protein n=1 Tax=Suhomyces tanzawaensis NRRL Y-17324 TaxID=984487 RepID=A0A1E4SIK1_9ASCO|nr:Nop52-domain-containing protein [Suhomyces tanzawaensis NRRL Y-17324]ODV79336.1 Nop52-domain-containing protein [Suhomyces tanzawaensis NRRL Y-17324]